MSRPSKLIPENIKVIVQAIRLGASYRHAAACAGISNEAMRDWLALGRKNESGKHHDFLLEVQKAEAFGVIENLRTIKSASVSDWRASAWILERRHPADYGSKATLTLEGNENAPLTIDAILGIGIRGEES